MSTPLHPVFVHLPLGLAVVMPLVAGFLLLAWWRDWLPRRSWWIAVGLQALLVAGGVAALQTGEADEEAVERVVSERAIESHEEAAELFVWAAGAVLVLGSAAGLLSREAPARLLAAGTVAGTLAVLGLGVVTGHRGGELVYVHGAAAATAAPQAAPGFRYDDEDD